MEKICFCTPGVFSKAFKGILVKFYLIRLHLMIFTVNVYDTWALQRFRAEISRV